MSEIDSQAQDRWDEFTTMKYKMLKRTTNDETPWTVVRSDDKHLARLNVVKAQRIKSGRFLGQALVKT